MTRVTISGVRIDHGEINAEDRLSDLPQDQWFALMQQRRLFLGVRLPHDCRCQLKFIDDAEKMARPLGFKDADDFIRRGLDLDPQQAAWAVDGLRTMKPDEPIPYKRAIAQGAQQHALNCTKPRTHAEAGKIGGRGKKPMLGRNRAGPSRTYAQRRADRLERDHPRIAERMKAGELRSVAQAERAARGETPGLTKLRRAWRGASEDERAAFRVEIAD